MLKLASETRATRPVHHRMTQQCMVDLLSEGVSESAFSTHAAFATDLRASTRPAVIAKMVFCNRNHKLLFEKIKDKIKAEYDELKAEARARVGRLVSTERQGQIGP